MRKTLCLGVIVAAGYGPCVPAVERPAYPTRPIRMIVANTTGTSVDTLARILAPKMSEGLGQQIVQFTIAPALR